MERTENAVAPADLGTLYRGAAAGPGFVQELEGEQAFGEAGFQADEAFGGAGHGRIRAEIGSRGHLLVTREPRGLGCSYLTL